MGLLYEAFDEGGSAPVHNVSVAWMHARACGHAWRRTLVGEEAWWRRGMGDDGGGRRRRMDFPLGTYFLNTWFKIPKNKLLVF